MAPCKKWTDDEVILLLKNVKNNYNFSEIAQIHKRTERAIRSKLKRMAAKYYYIDHKIIISTGLSEQQVTDAISQAFTTKQMSS